MIRGMPRLRLVLALGAVLCAGGCGGSAHAPTSTTATVVDATCQSSAGAGTAASSSCTFVLSDGERFSCGQPFKGPSPTAAQLERSGCRRLASLKLSRPELALIARLDGARTCLTGKGLRASGGPVLQNPSGPAPGGELVLSSAQPTFIAFYTDAAQAARLEPALARADSSSHVQVERRGAETVIWSAAPTSRLRASVRACLG